MINRWVLNPTRALGRAPLTTLGNMGRMGVFLGDALFYTFAPPLKFIRVLEQIRFIGFGSVLVIILTGAFTGMVLGFQGYYTLARVGSTAFLGPMVALALVRETGACHGGINGDWSGRIGDNRPAGYHAHHRAD